MSISNPFTPPPYRPIKPISSGEINMEESKGNLVINNEGSNLIIIKDRARKVIPLGKDIRLSDKDIAEIGRTFKTKLFKYFDTLEAPKGDIRNRLIEKCRQLSLRHDSSSTTTSSSSSTSFSTSSNDLTGTTQIAKNALALFSSSSTDSLTNNVLKQKSQQIQQLLTEVKTYLLDNADTFDVLWILEHSRITLFRWNPKFEYNCTRFIREQTPPEPGAPAESLKIKVVNALLKHPSFNVLVDYIPRQGLEVAASVEECLRHLKDLLDSRDSNFINFPIYALIELNTHIQLFPSADALASIDGIKILLRNNVSYLTTK